MDPIEALRSAIAKNKKLERKDGNVVIGMHVFPAKTITCMKKLQAYEKKESVKETSYYALDCIFYFWEVFSKDESLDHASYTLQCVDNGVDTVSFPQKDALLSYLKGKESSCIYFDTSAPFRYVKPQFEGATTASATSRRLGSRGNEDDSKLQADACHPGKRKDLRDALEGDRGGRTLGLPGGGAHNRGK